MVSDFQTIIDDKKSGSGAILKKTIRAVIQWIDKEKPDKEQFIRQIVSFYYQIPYFAVIFHFINQVLLIAEEANFSHDKILQFIQKYQQKWKNIHNDIYDSLIKHANPHKKTILLHSNSSTISAVFAKLAKDKIKPVIYQTLSAPGNEGRIQAKILAETGMKVFIITEASAAKFMDRTEMIFLGADIILPDHFINKTGSYYLTLLSREFQKKLYVLADSRKYIDKNFLPEKIVSSLMHEDLQPSDEIWKNPPHQITPLNYYFEPTPLSAVQGIISEKGLLKNRELKKKSATMKLAESLKNPKI